MNKKYVHALAVSDTHKNKTALNEVLNRFPDVDYIFHLGDNTSDALYLKEKSSAQVVYVRGNCDGNADVPDFEQIIIRGQKIVLTHGHTLGAKYSLERLFYYAQEQEARAIVFGHTHMPHTGFEDGIWLINPGSAGECTFGKRSVCMMLISEMGVVPKIIYLEG